MKNYRINKMQSKRQVKNILKNIFAGIFFCFSSIVHAAPLQFNMTPGVTPISRDIYYLHMTIFWVCVVIGVLVFGVMFYSLVKHRKSVGHKPAKFHSSLKIEILWAIIPFLILVVMAIPATIVLVRMEDSAKADMNIKVTGFQWKWKYEYLDQGISFYSNLSTPNDQLSGKAPKGEWYLLEVDKPLVLPIHKKIRFLVTSNDVIHSWWVPALGIKRDAIPGFIHEAWARIEKPGIYRGQCAELCGMHHGFMPIVVEAKTEEDFQKWVTSQTKVGAPTEAAAPSAPAPAAPAAPATQPAAPSAPTSPVTSPPPPTEAPKATPAPTPAPVSTPPAATTAAPPAPAAGAPTPAPTTTAPTPSPIPAPAAPTPAPAPTITPSPTPAAPVTPTAPSPAPAPAPPTPSAPAPAAGAAPAAQAPQPAAPTAPTTAPSQPAAAAAPSAAAPTPPAAAPSAPGMSKDDLIKKGKDVFESKCAVCHKSEGTGMPPAFPALAGSKIATGPLAAHLNRVLNGKPGTAMQAFGDQLSDEELAEVITYERNSWGNDNQQKFGKEAGGLVQPSDIAKAKTLPPSGD